ncbi:hypothetical protein EON64_20780, partial [archaeon]
MAALMSCSSQDDIVISNNGEEERFTTKVSYYSFDEDFYRQQGRSDLPQKHRLSVWPPPERHKVLFQHQSFIFSSSSEGGVGIYAANPECQRALEVTALPEWLRSFGVANTLKSRASESQLLVYIKNVVCSRAESFDLQVRPSKILLLAADYAGLLYGLFALRQVLAHHSVVSLSGGARQVSLPCLLLCDAPQSAVRAVRLSHRLQIRHAVRSLG